MIIARFSLIRRYLIVFGQTPEIGRLHLQQIIHSSHSNAHHGFRLWHLKKFRGLVVALCSLVLNCC